MPFKVAAPILLFLAPVFARAGSALPSDGHVTLIDRKGVQKVIEQHRGEILLINVWATWCVPCVEEMPDLAKLSQDDHVKVVGISIDDPEDTTSKVIPFLKKHGVPYPVFVKSAGGDEPFINALNKEWTGAVPATFIYDRSGRQRKMLIGKQTYGSLKKALKSLEGP